MCAVFVYGVRSENIRLTGGDFSDEGVHDGGGLGVQGTDGVNGAVYAF